MTDLNTLFAAVREDQDEYLAAFERAPGADSRREAVQRQLDRRSLPPKRALPRPLWLGAAAALAMAAALLVWLGRPQTEQLNQFAALTLTSQGAPVVTGAAVSGEAPLTFSDGTRILVERDARVRVLKLDERGAEVALEQGRLEANVVHREHTRWRVDAGPFAIHVTGTRFSADWDPVTRSLAVSMREGSVEVSGACLSQRRALVAGQSSTFSCDRPKPPATDEARTTARPKPAPTQPQTGRPRTTATTSNTAATSVADDWRALARASRFKEALAVAEARGFAQLCAESSAADALELGNVARLAGNPSRAAEAYSAVRSKAPGSTAGADAAFHLGKLAFDGAHNYGAAARWLGVYLSERPSGTFAPEALGRLMEAQHRLGQREAAVATAEQYLARYPSGVHAPLAQSLTQR